jgi:uncharacterized protein DUF1360
VEPLYLLIVMSLCAYRVTRLVVRDSFPPVQRLRDALVGADEHRLVGTRWEWFGELITCYWCAGFWVAGATVLVTDFVTSVPLPLIAWWAVAGVASLITFVEDAIDTWADANQARTELFNKKATEIKSETRSTMSAVR